MDGNLVRFVGEKLYNLNTIKGKKRYIWFKVRCCIHSKKLQDLTDFCALSNERHNLLQRNPSFLEQVTRAFFYKDSTISERINIIKEHIGALEKAFNYEFINAIYRPTEDGSVEIWKMDVEDRVLAMKLMFHPGQRKEGCMALMVTYNETPIYQIMFWFAKDKFDKLSIWIGAIQGPQNANEEIKLLTKKCFGYRPKNLAFYGIRSLAKVMDIEKIYAVTTEGYFAMSGIRMDRKLKVDFSEFWKECEGVPCDFDKRFYVMPVEEYRKDMSELKPSKRAQHRRRFEMLDNIDVSAKNALDVYKICI